LSCRDGIIVSAYQARKSRVVSFGARLERELLTPESVSSWWRRWCPARTCWMTGRETGCPSHQPTR